MRILSILALGLVFILPILVCAYPILGDMLGNNVGWSNLAWDKLDWSKFNGSQLANTYTPILAFFTLIFLVRQQNTTEKIIVAQQQREDLTYYLDVLLPYLQETKIEDGRSVYEWFKEDVARCSDEDAEQFSQQFLKLAEQSMEISTTWYAVWDSLEDVKKNTVLKQHMNKCEAKVITKLSFHVCVALDRYLIAVSSSEFIDREKVHFLPKP